MSARSNASGNMFPLLLVGALGLGIAYYLYNNNESGGIGGGSSAGSSWLFGDEGIGGIGGAATNSDRAMSPAEASAGAGAGAASGARSSSGGVSSAYVADVKKAATVQNYQPLSSSDIDYINSQLLNVYGEGSAYNFAKVQNNATMAATIQNTGINNAGKSLLSIVNSDNSYQVYDSRGQIVSSGSAGAFQGSVLLNTGIKSGGSSGSSSGGSSSSGAGSSKKAASISGGSLSSVNVTADKASAASSSGGSYKTGTITGKVGVSSGSSGGSSSPTSKKYTH